MLFHIPRGGLPGPITHIIRAIVRAHFRGNCGGAPVAFKSGKNTSQSNGQLDFSAMFYVAILILFFIY